MEILRDFALKFKMKAGTLCQICVRSASDPRQIRVRSVPSSPFHTDRVFQRLDIPPLQKNVHVFVSVVSSNFCRFHSSVKLTAAKFGIADLGMRPKCSCSFPGFPIPLHIAHQPESPSMQSETHLQNFMAPISSKETEMKTKTAAQTDNRSWKQSCA